MKAQPDWKNQFVLILFFNLHSVYSVGYANGAFMVNNKHHSDQVLSARDLHRKPVLSSPTRGDFPFGAKLKPRSNTGLWYDLRHCETSISMDTMDFRQWAWLDVNHRVMIHGVWKRTRFTEWWDTMWWEWDTVSHNDTGT